MRRNPIEYCRRTRRPFLKLTVKVRDKIVADGLVDETFDVTNIGIHLKRRNSMNLEDQTRYGRYAKSLRMSGHFTKAIKPDVDTFRESCNHRRTTC
jgi:UPF0176 protein